jgi:predicted Zn finger-like uncharacterized protein
MRITCPNCGAQYEVDDALIPETGRDVQCSNCGKGWFQARPPEPVETAEEEPIATEVVEEVVVEDTVAAEAAAPSPEPEPVEEPVAEVAEPEAPPQPRPEAQAAKPVPELVDEDEDEGEPPAALPARKPDESVLAVLREEAEREIAQRRQETAGIETQPDLGLAEPVERRATPAAEVAAGAAVAGAARRDLLPDIDMINSTLRSDAERGAAHAGDDDMVVERRRGFRTGFGLVLLLVAALILLYVSAGWLAQTVPALAPLLAAYVEAANGFRAWLDGLLAAGTAGLSE